MVARKGANPRDPSGGRASARVGRLCRHAEGERGHKPKARREAAGGKASGSNADGELMGDQRLTNVNVANVCGELMGLTFRTDPCQPPAAKQTAGKKHYGWMIPPRLNP